MKRVINNMMPENASRYNFPTAGAANAMQWISVNVMVETGQIQTALTIVLLVLPWINPTFG
jgi:hypothetical protein